jgi:hypothetical protein
MEERSYGKLDLKWRRDIAHYKHNKSCVICGCNEDKYLQFDHINPSNKINNISGGRLSGVKLKNEMAKCRILCIWCHRIHTKSQYTKRAKTREDYIHTKIKYTDGETLRECIGKICDGQKIPISYFYSSVRKDGRRRTDRTCKKCRDYKNNITRKQLREYVINYKHLIGSCAKCNRFINKGFECCFDFDHINQNNKINTISTLATRHSTSIFRIKTELDKCQLLCCYCHVNKTVKQLNHYNSYFYNNKDVREYDRIRNEHNKHTKLLNEIKQNVLTYDPLIITIKHSKLRICKECDAPISKKSHGLCMVCYRKTCRKAKRPSKTQLLAEIKELGYCETGRKYGVSDNAIRKWLKAY